VNLNSDLVPTCGGLRLRATVVEFSTKASHNKH
jgi:hypothetical protein